MRVKIRSLVQQAALACGAVTVCVLVFQNLAHSLRDSGEAERASPKFPVVHGWPERAPRSLNRDYELPAGVDNTVIGDTNADEATGIEKDEEEERQRGLLNTLVATATTKPATSLDDIFISVKTTKNFHKTRLDLILKTWFSLARQQVGDSSACHDSGTAA